MRRAEALIPAVRRAWPLLALLLLVAAVTGLASLGDASIDRVVVTSLVNLVLVVSLYVFVGTSGVFSFAQMAFAATGAYASAILTIPTETKAVLYTELPGFLADASAGPLWATLVGGIAAGALGLIVAIPVMRLTGIAAGLATFAVLIIFHVVAQNWTQVTNGSFGIAAIPTTTTTGNALLWALATIVAAYLFQQSRVGLRLRGSREDEIAARAAGIGVYNERRLAWVTSAFFSGVGGALFAQYIGAFNPDTFYISLTFLTLAMLVVGGLKSLSGAVVGTLVISFAGELLRRIEGGVDLGVVEVPGRVGVQQVGLALIMVGVLLLRPSGITGGREIRWPFGSGSARVDAGP